jgi:hypothetical protein
MPGCFFECKMTTEEKKTFKEQIALVDRLAATLPERVQADSNQFFAGLQERQPLILLLFLDYVNSGDFTPQQLEEILGLLLLVWLFHEEYYGRVFREVTDPELDAAMTRMEQGKIDELAGPKMLITHIGRRLDKEPSAVMRRVPSFDRHLLLLECLGFCACFEKQKMMR